MRWLRSCGPTGGPLVARTFHRALALVFLVAFASLAAQVHLLFGEQGLVPLPDFSDARLSLVCTLGIALSVASFLNFHPRVLAPVLALLYLSISKVGQPFLSFQWDNLLVEAGFMAAFLPRARRSRLAHFLLLALAVKLYFESGVAKQLWGGDQWWSGEAMELYYETAPLPSPLARTAHFLPAWWHLVESRGIVIIELVVPWLFFGPRPIRLAAVGIFTGFQVINLATANYGFFVYLALALHLFALDDRDLRWIRERTLDRIFPERAYPERRAWPWTVPVTAVYVAYWLTCSTVDGFGRFEPTAFVEARRTLGPYYRDYRTANTYHLFGPITTQRHEAEVEVFDGSEWVVLRTRYKPGPLDRSGVFVAPHQPRVEFQLWFYGLSRNRMPGWVRNLVQRICEAPAQVQPLFDREIPTQRQAVRIVFWRYRFDERPGRVWTRSPSGQTNALRCR